MTPILNDLFCRIYVVSLNKISGYCTMSVRSIPVSEMPHSVQMGGKRRAKTRNKRAGAMDAYDNTLQLMEEGELSSERLAEEGRSRTPPLPPPIVPAPAPLPRNPTDVVIDIGKEGGSRRRRRRNVNSRRTRRRSSRRRTRMMRRRYGNRR
jgi:hypothetical protein